MRDMRPRTDGWQLPSVHDYGANLLLSVRRRMSMSMVVDVATGCEIWRRNYDVKARSLFHKHFHPRHYFGSLHHNLFG